MKKILVVLGHPNKASYCAALADAYAAAAKDAGATVRTLALADCPFDPVLQWGYTRAQTLEATLDAAQADVKWADHLVFVYPNWWGSFPALLKGFFDRAFLPGFAFKYRPNSALWDKLLTGRSARVLVTMDSPPWYYRFIVGAPGDKQLRRAILEFCGISPVRFNHFGSMKHANAAKRGRWLEQAAALGRGDV